MKIDISRIINQFTSADNAGANSNKIDTYLEYHKLGEFLNGSQSYEELGCEFNQLKKSEQKSLVKIYKEAKEYITKNFLQNNNSIQISEDNIDNYKEIYEDLNYKNYMETITETELKLYDKIKNGLYIYCQNNNYDLEGADYDNLDYNFILKQISKRNQKEAEMREKGQLVVDRISNPYDNNLLKDAINKRITEENIQTLDTSKYSVDLGNGKYDKSAKQETELCWAHAGINGLLLSEEGQKLLNSNKYYDEKTGVFAIHIQEAEDNGLHGGIYTITPEELEAEGANLSSGEGDITAWMIAIKRYFDEMQQNPELIKKAQKKGQVISDVEKGNAQFRFFELITGAEPSRQNAWDEARLQVGVSYGKNDIKFNDIADIVSNKKGAAIICIGGHAISVVGINGDKLLVQESNLSENLGEIFFDDENNHTLFERTDSINNMPTYALSKHDFEHYNFGEGVIKWK